MKCIKTILFLIGLMLVGGSVEAVPIDLNDFFADPSVTVAADGSSAVMTEDAILNPVLLANDPGLGDPNVIHAGIGSILSFDFEFVEGGVGNNDEFSAFVLDSTGFSAGAAFEFFTMDTSSGSISFDLSSLLVSEPFIGFQFQLSALFGDTQLDSWVRITNVDLSTSVPEPSTLILIGTGLVGLVSFGRKKTL